MARTTGVPVIVGNSYSKAQNGTISSKNMALIKFIILIPLLLALFALILHMSERSSDSVPFLAETGLINEKDFMREVDGIPKLEAMLTKKKPLGRKGDTFERGSRRQRPIPVPFENNIHLNLDPTEGERKKLKIAFMVTTSEHPDQIILWMGYHRAIGVSLFYIFAEGVAGLPESIEKLSKEPGVKVIPRDEELTQKQSTSRAWNETWLAGFFNKPCNHELFVKQSLNMEMGIQFAKEDSVDWVLHIDTDELIYPSGSESYSLIEVLQEVPDSVDLLIFPNYESLAEHEHVEDPFMEVTLFKKSYAHVNQKEYFSNYGVIARGNPNYFTTYGNGKSAARVKEGLRPNGAHRWHNYLSVPKEWSSEQAAVLHYTYNKFSDLKSRRDRCDCAPTKEDAEKCFILDFDRIAFLEASLKDDDELMDFFKERLVWNEKDVVLDLIHKGVFGRMYEPQLLIRGVKQALAKKKNAVKEAKV